MGRAVPAAQEGQTLRAGTWVQAEREEKGAGQCRCPHPSSPRVKFMDTILSPRPSKFSVKIPWSMRWVPKGGAEGGALAGGPQAGALTHPLWQEAEEATESQRVLGAQKGRAWCTRGDLGWGEEATWDLGTSARDFSLSLQRLANTKVGCPENRQPH